MVCKYSTMSKQIWLGANILMCIHDTSVIPKVALVMHNITVHMVMVFTKLKACIITKSYDLKRGNIGMA